MKPKTIMRLCLTVAVLLLPVAASADFDAAGIQASFNNMNGGNGLVFEYTDSGFPGFWSELTTREISAQNYGGTEFADVSAYSTSHQTTGTSPLQTETFFSTFCVSNTSFATGTTSYGTLNYANNRTTTSDGTALTLGAAWLYKLMATGEINTVLYNERAIPPYPYLYGMYMERETDSIEFRKALFSLMGPDSLNWSNNFLFSISEYVYNGNIPGMGPSTTTAELTAFLTQTYDPGQYYDILGNYSVFVMNVTQDGSTTGDLLYLTPMSPGGGGDVPEPATILIWTLGSIGLAGSAWCRKRKAVREAV